MIRKKLLGVLGWIFLGFIATSYAARTKNLVVYVNTRATEPGDPEGNVDDFEKLQAARLAKQFPDSKIVFLRAATNGEVRDQLGQLVGQATTLKGLVIQSHGRPGYQIGTRDFKFYLDLRNEEEVHRVFSAVIGKFQPHAKIIFSGCDLAAGAGTYANTSALIRISKNFGLSSGTIYANQTIGEMGEDIFDNQPARDQPTISQALKTAIHPYLKAILALDLHGSSAPPSNEGYLLSVNTNSDGTRSYVLNKDDFLNSEMNSLPSGEKVATATIAADGMPAFKDLIQNQSGDARAVADNSYRGFSQAAADADSGLGVSPDGVSVSGAAH